MRRKPNAFGEMRHRICPGDEFRPVLGRQAEQLADDREWQHARIAFDQIGRAAVREQRAGERVRDGANTRLHVEHRTATEGFVDDGAQARVLRLVHGQHVVGEGRDEFGHPPAQAGERAILAQRENGAVLQHACGGFVCGRDPDLAYDRKPRCHHRATRAQCRNAVRGIAEERLAGEVDARCHPCASKPNPSASRPLSSSCVRCWGR
jgi:hypothetical protein